MESCSYDQMSLIRQTADEMVKLYGEADLTRPQLKRLSIEQANKVGITNICYFTRYVELTVPFKMEDGFIVF